MADNFAFTPGAGGIIRAKDHGSGIGVQVVGLDLNPGGGSEVLATAAALGDATANPTTLLLGSCLFLFNGTSWDRLQGDANKLLKATHLPTASGGMLAYTFISSGAVIAANVKNGPGQLYGVFLFNNATTPVWVRFYNETTSPVTTDTPVARMGFPGASAGAGGAPSFPLGMAFSTGIGVRITGGAADNDATIIASNQVVGTIFYF